MRRIAMIGFALATVSVLLAGCAAESSQEPLYTTVDTPYYDVMLPTSLFSSLAVDYDDSYRLDGDTGRASGSAFPCATRARKSRSGTCCAPRLRTVPTLAFRARWTKALLPHGPQRTCTCRSRSSHSTLPTA